MDIFLIAILISIGLFSVLIIWILRLIRLFRSGKKKSFYIQISILVFLFILITWQLNIFPLSKNFYIKEKTTELTGKNFWCWKEYEYEDISVRGEGYTLEIYKFNEKTAKYFENPEKVFFEKYPSNKFTDIKWTKTPIKKSDTQILEFVTPVYVGWKSEIIDKQKFIRQIANQSGAYYSYRNNGSTDFYLIVPNKRLVILINHNM